MEDSKEGSGHGTDEGQAHEEVGDALLDDGRCAGEWDPDVILAFDCADNLYVRLIDS